MDDTTLLPNTIAGVEEALHRNIEVAADFGVSVSISKTKLMVTGREAAADDRTPIHVADHLIESIAEFLFSGTVLSSLGRMKPDIR